MFEINNIVQLKEKKDGRYYKGKIIKIHNNLVRVGLPNGLYAEYPAEMWELAESEVSENE